jgi:hypothetical protein
MNDSEEIELAWKMIENTFEIEPCAEIEAEAKVNGFESGLAQAIFMLWKREPKVAELQADLARVQRHYEQLREACEGMIVGACAVAVPDHNERAVLWDAVNAARVALGRTPVKNLLTTLTESV